MPPSVSVSEGRTPGHAGPEGVARPRVLEVVARAAAHRIALLAAPAGFGKTTAIRQYLAGEGRPHVYYWARREDDTVPKFLQGFARALEPVAPGASQSLVGAYQTALQGGDSARDLGDWIASLVEGYDGTVVIDTLWPEHAPVAEIVVRAMNATHAPTRWIVAARSGIDLPIASWMAYGEMGEVVDEDALRFTLGECLALMQSQGIIASLDDVKEILDATGGWPAALTLALRARAQSKDFSLGTALAKDLVYRFLAEEVFRNLTAAERDFLLDTCLLPYLEPANLNLRFKDGSARLAALQRKATFLTRDETKYRYHDLFRDFLQHELRAAPGERFERVALESGGQLEAAGLHAQALSLYFAAAQTDGARRLLLDRGWEISDGGDFGAVASVLELLGDKVVESHPTLLALRARLRAIEGHSAESEAVYERALALAKRTGPDLIPTVLNRFVSDLLYRVEFEKAKTVLAEFKNDYSGDADTQAALLAARSVVSAYYGEREEALAHARQALALAPDRTKAMLRAIVLARAAWVFGCCGERALAKGPAAEALDLFAQVGFTPGALSTSLILRDVAADDDDTDGLRFAAERIALIAARTGDRRALEVSVLVQYDGAVERHDTAEIAELEPRVQAMGEGDAWVRQSANSRAMRLAWSGEFSKALALLRPNEFTLGTIDYLERAMSALFAAAGRDSERALQELEKANSVLERLRNKPASRSAVAAKGDIILALALAVLGRIYEARRTLVLIPLLRTARETTWAAIETAQCFCDWVAGNAERATLEASIESLAKTRLGSIAALIAALVKVTKRAPGLDSLTPAERRILDLLCAGKTSEEIGEQLGRSPLTVDTHVKTLLRKLGFKTRREAIAFHLEQAQAR